VQLLQIGGDPTQPGTLEPLPARIVVGETSLILDPVLLGTEGLQYETSNNASGLPASPDGFGANIRVAVALDGPLAIPGMRGGALTGLNNNGRSAIVRDFRSGNDGDTTPDLTRGFVLDPEPPRFIGELPMYLQQVDLVNQFMEVLIWKGGIVHEIDRGDVLRFIQGSSAVPFGSAEVVADPADDLGQPEVQRVRVRIRIVPDLEDLDPTNRPDYPQNPAELDAWLRQHAPRAVLVADYQGGRIDPATQEVIVRGDDPRYFGIFSPTPLPLADGSPSQPNENVSPFAGAVIRLSKPMDLTTVKMADTFFLATRNLTDQAAIDEFIATRPWRVQDVTGTPSGVGMSPSSFKEAKFRTPHLIASRVLDEDGSQTTLRLQPLQGFYLDQAMRQDGPRPYYLHVLAGPEGIRDLAGNPVDLQTNDVARSRGLVIPFTLDMRSTNNHPQFEDNYAVYIVRRFADVDEDENPSYYLPEEVQGAATQLANARAFELADLFGGFARIDGRIEGRPTSRLRKVADDFNQNPVDPQESILRWCPFTVGSSGRQVANNTATAPVGQGVQNPFNPYGCRLQTVWREIDLSLSRTDPFDFNLDVEQIFWAPFTGTPIEFDEFDTVSLQLGHSERRPEPCVGNFGALPTFPASGLWTRFDDNYVRNIRANSAAGDIESRPQPHRAFDAPIAMRIDAQSTVHEPSGRNRFLSLPTFKRPYFVYRDETLVEQGCSVGAGSDVINNLEQFGPWILSPWNNGIGRRTVQDPDPPNGILFQNGFWQSGNNFLLRNDTTNDAATEGLLGNIALPLLADFFVECDSAQLPAGNGYTAFGLTGWQVSVALQANPQPNFRVYTAGRPPFPGMVPICREPGSTTSAQGGHSPPPPTGTGLPTAPGDNTFYWVMIDFLKRQSVATSGFVDLYNPHRVPVGFVDSRLGPYFTHAVTGEVAVPPGYGPRFDHVLEPPTSQLPGGTSIVPQFRAAGAVDPDPWYWREWIATSSLHRAYPANLAERLQPDASNFGLDPYKAADAHIRKFDDRQVGGVARNWWTYFYNRTVTGYSLDANSVVDPVFLSRSAGPNEGFTPADVRYVGWRLVLSNNVDAVPAVSPSIETFALAYRFQRVQ
jgi:hypothetical protein